MKKKNFLVITLTLISQITFAQLKVGSNPTNIGNQNNFEIEGTNGKKVYVLKDGKTYIENTPKATKFDSVLFKNSSGEVRSISIQGLKEILSSTIKSDTFRYSTVGWQTYTVPSGVSEINFEVNGSKGGGAYGGNGARVKGVLKVNPNQTLYILVGKKGIYNGGKGGINTANGNNNGLPGGDAAILASAATPNNSLVIAAGGGGQSGMAGSTLWGGHGGEWGGNGANAGFQGYSEGGKGASIVGGPGSAGWSYDCAVYGSGWYAGWGGWISGGNGGNANIATHFGGGGGGGGYYGGGGNPGGGSSTGSGGGGCSWANFSAVSEAFHIMGANTGDGYIILSY